MYKAENHFMGLREIRLEDKRLSILPSPDSRFRAAALLVDFYAKKSGAMILSWCVESTEVIILAQGGDTEVKIPTLVPERPNKESLLHAAAKEEQRAIEYEQAYSLAQDHNTAMGYLDLASEAKAAATALTARAVSLD